MKNAAKTLKTLLRCTHGATAIEYAMIAAMVSVVAVISFASVTGSLSANYYNLISGLLR